MGAQRRQKSGQVVIELGGRIADDLVEYAEEKIESALRHTARPIPRAEIRVVRHNDRARSHPITARPTST